MTHRRLPRKYKPDADIPLPVRLAIDAPITEIDQAIEDLEKLLAQMKRLRFVLSRRREKDRKRFIESQDS
jgi:hypothetical protein